MDTYDERGAQDEDDDECNPFEETRRCLRKHGAKTLSQLFGIPSKSINSLPVKMFAKK